MPKLKLITRCVLTNSRKPKPHQLVVSAQNGHLIVTRNGRAFPWPKDVKLIVKGRSTHKALFEHFEKMMEPRSI